MTKYLSWACLIVLVPQLIAAAFIQSARFDWDDECEEIVARHYAYED